MVFSREEQYDGKVLKSLKRNNGMERDKLWCKKGGRQSGGQLIIKTFEKSICKHTTVKAL